MLCRVGLKRSTGVHESVPFMSGGPAESIAEHVCVVLLLAPAVSILKSCACRARTLPPAWGFLVRFRTSALLPLLWVVGLGRKTVRYWMHIPKNPFLSDLFELGP